MGKGKKVKKLEALLAERDAADHHGNMPEGKLKGGDYARELARLHVEMVKLQEWVLHKKLKVCIVFEGRDGAGKGGTIKAITERGGCPARC